MCDMSYILPLVTPPPPQHLCLTFIQTTVFHGFISCPLVFSWWRWRVSRIIFTLSKALLKFPLLSVGAPLLSVLLSGGFSCHVGRLSFDFFVPNSDNFTFSTISDRANQYSGSTLIDITGVFNNWLLFIYFLILVRYSGCEEFPDDQRLVGLFNWD